jgi:uncharacterized iron-regulated protein
MNSKKKLSYGIGNGLLKNNNKSKLKLSQPQVQVFCFVDNTHSSSFYRLGDKNLKKTMEYMICEAYPVWGTHLVIFLAQLDTNLDVILGM